MIFLRFCVWSNRSPAETCLVLILKIYFSYPTLNVPVPEEVLEDPRLLFHLDPVIGERAENLASKKVILKSTPFLVGKTTVTV